VGATIALSGDSRPQHVATGMLDTHRAEIGRPAPDFELVDVRDGRTPHRLSDFRGRTVVLNWYASWCGPCRAELPYFQDAYRSLGGDVVFLAINVEESRADAASILAETGATFPAVLDSEALVAAGYDIRGLPSTFFVDAQGILRAGGSGGISAGVLAGELANLGHLWQPGGGR
jgi:thiol-disulfide isomerase/thioredoxin